MTLGQVRKRIEAVHGEPMPCALETLPVALRREGFSFKRNRFSLKKRNQEDFEMTSTTLDKLKCAARANAVRLLYLDETAFAASPPVRRAWSPRGIEPCVHCRRSVLGAFDFGANTLAYHVASSPIKRDAAIAFIEQIARQGDQRPTVAVLDNA